MCIVTTLNEGLRNGGGIGDVLRKPSSMVTEFVLFYSNGQYCLVHKVLSEMLWKMVRHLTAML